MRSMGDRGVDVVCRDYLDSALGRRYNGNRVMLTRRSGSLHGFRLKRSFSDANRRPYGTVGTRRI